MPNQEEDNTYLTINILSKVQNDNYDFFYDTRSSITDYVEYSIDSNMPVIIKEGLPNYIVDEIFRQIKR